MSFGSVSQASTFAGLKLLYGNALTAFPISPEIKSLLSEEQYCTLAASSCLKMKMLQTWLPDSNSDEEGTPVV